MEESGQGKGEEKSWRKTFGGQATKYLLRRTASGLTKDAQAQSRFSRSVRKTKTEQARAAQ